MCNGMTRITGAESRHSVPLDQDVALSQQLYGLQCGSVWTNQTLSPMHGMLIVSHERFDLDNVTGYVVLKHSSGLP